MHKIKLKLNDKFLLETQHEYLSKEIKIPMIGRAKSVFDDPPIYNLIFIRSNWLDEKEELGEIIYFYEFYDIEKI